MRQHHGSSLALDLERRPTRRLTAGDLPPSLQPDLAGGRNDVRQVLLGAKEGAALLGVSRSTLWRYARDGRIKLVVVGTNSRPEYKYHRRDLELLKHELDEERRLREARQRKRVQKQMDAFLKLSREMLAAGEVDLGRVLRLTPARQSRRA